MASLIFTALVLFLTSFAVLQPVAGGCFRRINAKKNCEGFLYQNLNVAECCDRNGKYYTLQNDTYENIFRLSVLKARGGIQGMADCLSCEEWKKGLQKNKLSSCKNKVCPAGQVCRQVNNTAKCVCNDSQCNSVKIQQVCSNQNITYKSECHMKLSACKTGRHETVQYYGSCQASCAKVHCRKNKQCMQDQSNRLYCVRCNILPCNGRMANGTAVCGLNNVTYMSTCHLRKATCLLGRTIGIAYAGKCRSGARCSTTKCTAASNSTKTVHHLTMKQLQALRTKSITGHQFLRMIKNIGFKVPRKFKPKKVLNKKINVNLILCYIHKLVNKGKLSGCQSV